MKYMYYAYYNIYNISIGKDVDKLENLYTASGNVKWYSQKHYGGFSKTRTTYDPAVSFQSTFKGIEIRIQE